KVTRVPLTLVVPLTAPWTKAVRGTPVVKFGAWVTNGSVAPAPTSTTRDVLSGVVSVPGAAPKMGLMPAGTVTLFGSVKNCVCVRVPKLGSAVSGPPGPGARLGVGT